MKKLFFLVLFPLYSFGNQPPGNSILTIGKESIMEFRDGWTDEFEVRHNAPFVMPGRSKVLLRFEFSWPVSLPHDSVEVALSPDTLFLFAQGVTWTGSVFINGVMIGRLNDPFSENIFGFSPGILKPGTNLLSLSLTTEGPEFRFYPHPAIGVSGKVLLLSESGLHDLPVLPHVTGSADSAVIFNPWKLSEYGEFTERDFLSHLVILKKAGVHTLCFPFDPPGNMLAISREMGFRQLLSPDSALYLGFYNACDYELTNSPFRGEFWIDENGKKTNWFGKYYDSREKYPGFVPQSDRITAIALLILVLLFLVLVRFVAPRIYEAVPEYLMKPKIQLDLIAAGKFMQTGQAMFVSFLRILVFAVSLSFFLCHLKLSGRLDVLNITSAESVLYRLLGSRDWTLLQIAMVTFAVISLLTLGRQALLLALGFIYRIPGLAVNHLNLDILSSFPLNFMLVVPAASFYFLDITFGENIAFIWEAIFFLILIRRFYVVAGGQKTLFRFRAGLIFLYICTLEILPWMLLI